VLRRFGLGGEAWNVDVQFSALGAAPKRKAVPQHRILKRFASGGARHRAARLTPGVMSLAFGELAKARNGTC
jgi:hypothetical protein